MRAHAGGRRGARRAPADPRKVVRGAFWILDPGAKWRDLPKCFGSKSTVHRWFQKWVNDGVFEAMMRDAGRCVEERGGYRLYECFIDGIFSRVRGGVDGIGCDKAYDSDRLDEELAAQEIEMIAPHRSNRKLENITQDGRSLRRYDRCWKVERTISWFQNFPRLCIRRENSATVFQGFFHLGCTMLLLEQVLG